jgi:hypothetical protein
MPRTSQLRAFLVTTLAITLATGAAAQGFAVASVDPPNGARGVSPAAVITLTFTAAVDAATVTPQSVRVAGRWSGPVPGILSVAGATVTFAPLRPLFATEIGTLMVAHGVRSTAGAGLAGGFTSTWWVDAVASSGTFVLDHVVDYRRPGEGLIRTYGFFAGDVDRDGAPDMSATNEVSFDIRLLKNSGCGSFGPLTITPLPGGQEPSPNEGADFDGDGWIDLVTGNQSGLAVAVFLNDRAGNYRPPVIHPVGGPVHGVAVVDADSDGDVDVLAANLSNVALLRNNGNGTFQAPTFFDGGGSGEWCLAVADANNDGKADLFCGNASSQTVALLLGDGAGTFAVSSTRSAGGSPWQMAAGDVDGDGFADCVVAAHGPSAAGVLTGNGAGGLNAVVSWPVGSSPVSVDIGDAEGDDDLDIVVANFGSANAVLLRNNGAGAFGSSSALAASSAGSCAVIVDHDRDGDTDVILVDELDDKAFVWRQAGPAPAGVQPPGCDAALRINGHAGRAGYGGAAARHLPGGALAFVDVSGQPGQPWALVAGVPLEPGQASPFGLLNLDLAAPFVSLVNGFAGGALGLLDGHGEATLPMLVPVGLPPGTSFALQGVVAAPALVATNPERVVF